MVKVNLKKKNKTDIKLNRLKILKSELNWTNIWKRCSKFYFIISVYYLSGIKDLPELFLEYKNNV